MACPSTPTPPTTNTRPSWSRVELWFARAFSIGGVATKPPALGLYRSTDALNPPSFDPPVTSTRPSGRSTADAPARPTTMSPVTDHVFDGICGSDARTSKLYEAITVETRATDMTARFISLSPLCEFRNPPTRRMPRYNSRDADNPPGQWLVKSFATKLNKMDVR